MKPTTNMKFTLLRACVAAAAVVAVSAPAHAAVILTGNATIPGSSAVNTSSTVTDQETDLRPGRSLEQTFTVGAQFKLDAIFIEYQASGGGYLNGTFNLRLYSVANVNGGNPPTVGTQLLTIPITLDAAARTAANFTSSPTISSILKFDLTGDDEITLAATTGNAGYALQFDSAATDPATTSGSFFTWRNSTTSSYATGRYEGSSIADAPVYLTAVPEPSSFLCLLIGVTGLASRRRR